MNENALILDLIFEAMKEINKSLPADKGMRLSPQECLLGEASVLDSLGLLNLVTLIERKIKNKFQVRLLLFDARILSRQDHPFRSAQALADHIAGTLAQAGRLAARSQS